MKIMPTTIERRNERITARLRRIQGQIAAIERSLVEDPDGAILLQRVAAARCRFSFTCRTILLIAEGLRYS